MRTTKFGTIDRRCLNGKATSDRAREQRFDTKTGNWLCRKCGDHKPLSDYYKISPAGIPISYCKPCAYEQSHAWAKKKAQETVEQRAALRKQRMEQKMIKRNAQTMQCKRCGSIKTLAEWPKEGKTTKLLKYCCSARNRSYEDVENDIRLGSKVCKHCHERKPFQHFSPHRDRKDGRQTVCRMCRSAKTHSGEWNGNTRRQALIDARSDGSITSDHMRKIFSVKICPCCDGYMERNDKVLDHIIPLKLNGFHSKNNVTVMCRACNSAKSAYHPANWLKMLRDDAAERMRAHYASMGLYFDE